MLYLNLFVVILALAGGALMLWKIPKVPLSPAGDQPDDIDSSQLSIIIPARNEQQRLPALLASLQRQDLALHEILVVDDQSTDETAAVARAGGAKVIAAGEPARGSNGKAHACWTGALAAHGSILLFLDADTWLDRSDSLRRLLQAFHQGRTGGSGILSVQPYHEVRRLYENLSAVFNLVVLAGVNGFTPWGARLGCTGAFGPCLMCSRKEYFATGGHAAVGASVMDDVALGSLFRRQGLPVRCLGGRGLIRFRMYPEGTSQLCEGWTKCFAAAAPITHPLVLAMIIFWIGGAFSSLGFLLRTAGMGNVPWLVLAVLCCLAYLAQFISQVRRVGNFRVVFLVVYPLPFLFFTGLFAWSIICTRIRHRVRWRGRDVLI